MVRAPFVPQRLGGGRHARTCCGGSQRFRRRSVAASSSDGSPCAPSTSTIEETLSFSRDGACTAGGCVRPAFALLSVACLREEPARRAPRRRRRMNGAAAPRTGPRVRRPHDAHPLSTSTARSRTVSWETGPSSQLRTSRRQLASPSAIQSAQRVSLLARPDVHSSCVYPPAYRCWRRWRFDTESASSGSGGAGMFCFWNGVRCSGGIHCSGLGTETRRAFVFSVAVALT